MRQQVTKLRLWATSLFARQPDDILRSALRLLPWIGAIAFVTFLWDLFTPFSSDWATRGQIGDFLGGHVSAFSNLATLIFVAAAYLTQRRELEQSETARNEEQTRFQNQMEVLRTQTDMQTRQVREAFIMQFLSNLRNTEGLFGSREDTDVVGWSIVSNCAQKTIEDGFPEVFQELLNESNWQILRTYLRQVDFISNWCTQKGDRQLTEHYFNLVRVHLPPDFFADIRKHNNFGSKEFMSLQGLLELTTWEQTQSLA